MFSRTINLFYYHKLSVSMINSIKFTSQLSSENFNTYTGIQPMAASHYQERLLKTTCSKLQKVWYHERSCDNSIHTISINFTTFPYVQRLLKVSGAVPGGPYPQMQYPGNPIQDFAVQPDTRGLKQQLQRQYWGYSVMNGFHPAQTRQHSRSLNPKLLLQAYKK